MSELVYPYYYKSQDLNWRGVLKGVKKANDVLQPLYEAITNSLESIELRKNVNNSFSPYVTIDLHYDADLEDNTAGLSKIIIKDNGIGFDEENFTRLKIFKDDTKGFNNRGSGRIQLLHSFDYCLYRSVYEEHNAQKQRVFILSKGEDFLANNSILKVQNESIVESLLQETTLEMVMLRDKSDLKIYNELTADVLKTLIIDHYIIRFCAYAEDLPCITINLYQQDSVISTARITLDDIPSPSANEQSIEVPMCIMSEDMKRVEPSDNMVSISIKSFKLASTRIKKNAVKLTCKNELIDSVKIKIQCLPPDLEIDSSRYLFLLSSDYFDENIGDTRDDFEILNKTEFKKRAKQYGTIASQIVLDDIEEKVSEKAAEMYSEISEQKENHQIMIENLKKTYLLSDESLSEANVNDSIEDILIKAYSYDARLVAKQDAEYQSKVQELNTLNTTAPNYREELERLVCELSETIPLQRKESLARYVTHRTLVLELFGKLINRETDIQNQSERSMDEKLIHNLIFSQGKNDSSSSDIWMLNEDYLYYKGFSEQKLSDIEIDGHKLFKQDIDEEENRYLHSLGENRLAKRPDILLFPSEHKCVIVELKSLDANISNYLHQINKYASFIRSYTTDQFYIDTFYGYLVGEAMEPNDIRAADTDFKYDPKFNFCYRPSKAIACLHDMTGKSDGTIYTEALSFSVLLERALSRNNAFKTRLFPEGTTVAE